MSKNETTRHPHADVIIAWAEGKTVQKKQPSGHWHDVPESPSFYRGYEYRIKPEPVEVRTCNGVVITPMTTVPELNSRYYVADPTIHSLCQEYCWRNDNSDQLHFVRGLVHSTAQSAYAHAQAMLAYETEVRDV